MFISRYDFDIYVYVICIQILNIIHVWIFREQFICKWWPFISISSYSDDTHNNVSTMQFIQVWITIETIFTQLTQSRFTFYEFVTTPKICRILPEYVPSFVFFYCYILFWCFCFYLVAWRTEGPNLTLIWWRWDRWRATLTRKLFQLLSGIAVVMSYFQLNITHNLAQPYIFP